MRTYQRKLHCLLLFIFILSYLTTSKADETTKELVNIRPIIENANEDLFRHGITKTVYELPASTGKRIVTTYFYQNHEMEKLTYRESKLFGKYSIITNRTITRPDGKWDLRLDVAIKEPDEMVRSLHDNSLYQRDSAPIMGTVEDCMEEGVASIRVSNVISDKDKDVSLKRTMELIGQINVMEGATAKKVTQLTEQNCPWRFEYLINKDTGIIMRIRSYTQEGKLLNDTKYLTVEQNYDVPISIFDIPKDYRILFPQSISEYFSALQKYVDTTKIRYSISY